MENNKEMKLRIEKKLQKINETISQFFEKVYRINKPLTRLKKEK